MALMEMGVEVLHICVSAAVASYGAKAVRQVNRKKELTLSLLKMVVQLSLQGNILRLYCSLPTSELSTVHGHILAHLDIADLNLGRGG